MRKKTLKNKNPRELCSRRTLLFHNKKGFTLVEMLVSIAIFAIIGSIMVSIFIFQGFSLYRSELDSNEDESNIRSTMAKYC